MIISVNVTNNSIHKVQTLQTRNSKYKLGTWNTGLKAWVEDNCYHFCISTCLPYNFVSFVPTNKSFPALTVYMETK